MMKAKIIGGVYQTDDSWWHYYLGGDEATMGISGNCHTKEQASQYLQAKFDQAVEQFGDNWEVTIERKDF